MRLKFICVFYWSCDRVFQWSCDRSSDCDRRASDTRQRVNFKCFFFFVYHQKSVGLKSSGSVLDMFFRTVLLLCACFHTSTPVYQSAVAPFFVSFFFPFLSYFLSFFFPSFPLDKKGIFGGDSNISSHLCCTSGHLRSTVQNLFLPAFIFLFFHPLLPIEVQPPLPGPERQMTLLFFRVVSHFSENFFP